MGDRTITSAEAFPGVCAPLVSTESGQWSCKLVEDGPVALVETDPTKTMVMHEGGATVMPQCLRYDAHRRQIFWSGHTACIEALSPHVAHLRALDHLAASEMTTAVDVLRMDRSLNAVAYMREQLPTALELIIRVAKSPEVDIHPMILAAILNIEGKWLYRHKNRLGPGQVEPHIRRHLIATEEFQRAWVQLHHNLPVPIPPAEASVLADLLVVGIYCARLRNPQRGVPGLPVPRFADRVTTTSMRQFVRQAQALRVCYGYPMHRALAHRVLSAGHGVVASAKQVRAGFVGRLDAFGRITQRLVHDYEQLRQNTTVTE